jgi:putative nucleotidyltransferase with HDIG domain
MIAIAASAVAGPVPASIDPVVLVVLLTLAGLARVRPIHVSTKMKVIPDDAAIFPAAVLMGPVVVAQIVLWASIVPSTVPAKTPLYNRLFNVAAKALAAIAAAYCYFSLRSGDDIFTNPLPMTAAAVVMYLVGTALTDVVVALQLRRDPLRAWWPVHRRDIAYHGALYAIGALAVFAARTYPWLLLLIAVPIVVVSVSLERSSRLREQTRAAIKQFADLIDRRDKYTYGHSQRVAVYAERLARRMRLAPAQVELVTEAARLHDLGKVATPDNVLLKPGSLSQEESGVMREHAETGYRVLKSIPDFWDGAALVRAHHERADGTGYPLAIGGIDLPLEASIIAVCDAYDAMSSNRVYRKALATQSIREEFARGRGSQWDARVVDELLAMLSEANESVLTASATEVADDAARPM